MHRWYRYASLFVVMIASMVVVGPSLAAGSIVYVCYPDCVDPDSPVAHISPDLLHTDFSEQRRFIRVLNDLAAHEGTNAPTPVKLFDNVVVINGSDVSSLPSFWGRVAAESGAVVVVGSAFKLVPELIATTQQQLAAYGASTTHLFLVDTYLYSTDYTTLSRGEYSTVQFKTEMALWRADADGGTATDPFLNVAFISLSDKILADVLAVGLTTLSNTSRMLAIIDGGVDDSSAFRGALVASKSEVCDSCELIIHSIFDLGVIPSLLEHYRHTSLNTQMVDSILVTGDKCLTAVLDALVAVNETGINVIHMGPAIETAATVPAGTLHVAGQEYIAGEVWVNSTRILHDVIKATLFPTAAPTNVSDTINATTGAISSFKAAFEYQWSMFLGTEATVTNTQCSGTNATASVWGAGVNCAGNSARYAMSLFYDQHQSGTIGGSSTTTTTPSFTVNPSEEVEVANVTTGVSTDRTSLTSVHVDGESTFTQGVQVASIVLPEVPLESSVAAFIHHRNVLVSLYENDTETVGVWVAHTFAPRLAVVYSPQVSPFISVIDLVSRGVEFMWVSCNETLPLGPMLVDYNGDIYIMMGTVLGSAVSSIYRFSVAQYPSFDCEAVAQLSSTRRRSHTATLVMRHDLEQVGPTLNSTTTTTLRRSFLMIGGSCDGSGLCSTCAVYTLGGSPEWAEVTLVEEDHTPFLGRQNHQSVLWQNQPMTIGSVTSSDWLVMVGGTSSVNESSLAVVFVPLNDMFPYSAHENITTKPVRTAKLWVPNVAPVTGACVMVAEGRLVIAGGIYLSDGSDRTTMIMFDSATQQWSDLITVSNWNGGETACAHFGSTHNDEAKGEAVSVALSLQPSASEATTSLTSADVMVLKFRNCKAEGMDPYYTGVITPPGGQECYECPRVKFYASEDGLHCRPCSELSLVTQDNVPRCSVINNEALYITFFGMIAIQLIAVPVLWVCITMAQRSAKMKDNEQATIEMSEAVAEMMFERVAYLDTIKNPSMLQISLLRCVNTFKAYRTYIPLPVLTIVDNVVMNRDFGVDSDRDADSDDAQEMDELLVHNGGSTLVNDEGAVPRTRRGSDNNSFSTELSQTGSGAGGALSGRHASGRWGDLRLDGSRRRRTITSRSATHTSRKRDQQVASKYVNTADTRTLPVSHYVLQALSNGLSERAITVVASNIVRYHAWCDEQGSDAALVRHHRRYYDAVLQGALLSGGSPDMIMGDKMLISWNSAQQSPDHLRLAIAYAFEVSRNPVLKKLKMKICLGISSGVARVGIVGGGEAKHFTVLSSVGGEAFALCRLAPRHGADTLLEWSSEVQRRVSDSFVFRVVGAGNFSRNCSTGSRMRVPDEPPQQSTRLLCELLGPTDHSQWLYERKGAREHIAVFNSVMRAVFMGRIEEAKAISLEGMPHWYSSVLQRVLRDRYLFPEEVSAM